MTRLCTLEGLPPQVARPAYDRAACGAGIVHIGLGAFHKAHQAAYTDAALAAEPGDWRILGVSLRSRAPAEELTPQHGLYTLIERDAAGSSARVIGAIARALSLGPDRGAILAALTDPATRIVTLTVTEKGYGIDRATGGVDLSHPVIAADLDSPEDPQGVAGLLVWALGRRRAADIPPFTLLCCDNLPENGKMLKSLLVDFALRADPPLASHIASDVACPSTMVDRITPARTEATLAEAARLTGHEDRAAVETERFTQWVIEDDFPTGRPAWEAGGALFVTDVAPYEKMKLRMLNGAHSMLAYAGFLAGHEYVRDAMGDGALVRLIRRQLAAASRSLPPLEGVDLGAYAEALIRRFANPHLAHETWQIAMDGTEKLPQRILAPATEALEAGAPLDAFAFATAAWMRYALGRREDGTRYALRDPREAALGAALEGLTGAGAVAARLLALPGLFPDKLRESAAWQEAVTARLDVMLAQGMRAAIDREAAAC